MRGAAGYLLVADGTRAGNIGDGFRHRGQVRRDVGPLPYVLVLNKADLPDHGRSRTMTSESARQGRLDVLRTEREDRRGLDDAFLKLAAAMLEP